MIERFNFLKPFESSMEYPKEYNPRVHGPYNPSIYYGPKDTPFGETKIKDLVSWVLRREKSAASVSGLVNRAMWRYRFAYILPKKSSAAPIYHCIILGFVGAFMLEEYSYRSQHTYAKYH